MEEFFIVARDRSQGLPNLCKTQFNELFFDAIDAAKIAGRLTLRYGVSFSVYRCEARVVEWVEPEVPA